VSFTDLSNSYDGITTWEWDFDNDDVVDSTVQNPTYVYMQDGSYTVTLRVYESDGDSDTEIKVDYVMVTDTEPNVNFSATPTSGLEPLQVNFTGISTSYDGIISWNWSFGDGETSTEQNPIHVYAADGTYSVSLTVSEADEDSSTETKFSYIIVHDSIPVASFTYSPSNPLEGDQATFNVSGSTGYDQPIYCSWDFGDGAFGEGVSPAHAYAQDGDYLVTLTVTDADGSTDSTSLTITVADKEPIPDFTASPTSGPEPLTVSFTDLSNSYDGITTWDWDFNNDGAVDSTERSPTHTYTSEGTYSVSLTVYEADGDSAHGTITITALLDTDGDRTPDLTDPDDDNDGVNDDEDEFPLDLTEWVDTDGDGIGNNADTDDDNDGVPDVDDTFPLDASEFVDTDGDLIGNNADTDDDNDGIQDDWEILHSLDPFDPSDASLDFDGDGLSNLTEYQIGSDPNVPDVEVPLDTDGDGDPDITDTDDDNDGVNDDEDAFPLDPTETVDTDGDEIGNNADTDDDNDGVPDVTDAFPLDPTETVDTDGDGVGDNADQDDDNDEMPDTWETENGLDPLEAADASIDVDDDGLTNLEEYQGGTNPNISDAQAFPLWVLGTAAAVVIGWAVAATFLWRRRK